MTDLIHLCCRQFMNANFAFRMTAYFASNTAFQND